MKESHKKQLADLFGENVHWDCSLKRYTSFVIGGPAAALIKVEDSSDIQQLLQYCHKEKIAWRVIGRGTNLLVHDRGFDGVVILLGNGFGKIDSSIAGDNDRITVDAGAGVGLSKLADWCADRGITGMEFAVGIPGSLGGAVVMNAGAWGASVGDTLLAVELVGDSGTKILTRDQLSFGYRCWRNYKDKAAQQIVTRSIFELRRDSVENIKKRCREIREKRRMAQPQGGATCGSFFKNPQNDSAGRLIEACGLKGARVGGAMVSEKHANFFINTGDATADDMIRLMEMVKEKVMEYNGTVLEEEVHFL